MLLILSCCKRKEKEPQMAIGLDDVVAAETALSDVDGLAGRLVIRGHSLDELAGHTSSEELLAMLFDGAFEESPTPVRLGEARAEVFERFTAELPALTGLPLYDSVRATVARLPDDNSLETALLLIAAPAVLVSALVRLRDGNPAIAPDPERGHASDIVRMLGNEAPGAPAALDTYLVTVA